MNEPAQGHRVDAQGHLQAKATLLHLITCAPARVKRQRALQSLTWIASVLSSTADCLAENLYQTIDAYV